MATWIDHQRITTFCQQNNIHWLALFGSVLRDDFKAESDIDVLVMFEPEAQIGFFEFARINRELSELLGREVDLHTPNSISDYFREHVLATTQTIYEKTA
jgi:predicted nucleotidyltransferase